MDKLAEKLGDWLPIMAAKLGVAAEHVYAALVKYYVALLIGETVAAVLAWLLGGLGALVAFSYARKYHAIEYLDRYRYRVVHPIAVVFYVVAAACCLPMIVGFVETMFHIGPLVAALASPDGYAITKILTAVR